MLDEFEFLFDPLADRRAEVGIAIDGSFEGFLEEVVKILPVRTEDIPAGFDRLEIEGKLTAFQDFLGIGDEVAVIFAARHHIGIAIEAIGWIGLLFDGKLAQECVEIDAAQKSMCIKFQFGREVYRLE